MKSYQITYKDKSGGQSLSAPKYYLYPLTGKLTPLSGRKLYNNQLAFMFSDVLKEGTREVHTGLEKKLVAQIRKVGTTKDYIQLLELMYGFYQPLQNQLEPFLDTIPQLGGRGRQAANILQDIHDLDPHHIPQIQHCKILPDIHSAAAALGALYVTEGSTLGGRHITRMIARQLDIPATKGFSFFDAYGDSTAQMWENFRDILNQPRSQNEQQEMKNAAMETFSTFNNWIVLYESRNN